MELSAEILNCLLGDMDECQVLIDVHCPGFNFLLFLFPSLTLGRWGLVLMESFSWGRLGLWNVSGHVVRGRSIGEGRGCGENLIVVDIETVQPVLGLLNEC